LTGKGRGGKVPKQSREKGGKGQKQKEKWKKKRGPKKAKLGIKPRGSAKKQSAPNGTKRTLIREGRQKKKLKKMS